MNIKSKTIAHGALICALYVVLTFISNAVGLGNGVIQVRISEALTILPVFTPAAIPGLAIGCLLSNLLTGCIPGDILFGTVATLLGALGTYALRKRPSLAVLPPIIANTVIVPLILAYMYRIPGSLPFFFLTVGIGEVISCGILGTLLYKFLRSKKNILFR